MLRRTRWTILLVSIVLFEVCAGAVLCTLISRQEAALDQTVDETVIHCVVTSTQGTKQDHLNVTIGTVNRLLGLDHERGFYQDKYVKNVRSKIRIELTNPANYSIVCILSADSDPALTPIEGGELTLFDGWDESVFMSDEAVCIVPQGFPTDGELEIETTTFPIRLTVIGTHTGPKNTIYCPFYTVQYANGMTYSFTADSCSFDIRDTRKVEEAKASLYEMFVKPDIQNSPGSITYGVRIEDDLFQSTVTALNSSIKTLRFLLPVLLLIGVAVGFFASYLSTRSRLKEYAVMRCLGMRRGEVLCFALSEQLMIALVGGILGFAVGTAINGTFSLRMLLYGLGGIAAFLIGTALSASRITWINVMQLMKTEE